MSLQIPNLVQVPPGFHVFYGPDMQPVQLEPVKTLECQMDGEITQSPVYLKNCSHIFDRTNIKDYFRHKLVDEQKNFAECPVCRRVYSIARSLENGLTREAAANRLFDKILIVPVVSIEINRQLEMTQELKLRLAEANTAIDKKDKQITLVGSVCILIGILAGGGMVYFVGPQNILKA